MVQEHPEYGARLRIKVNTVGVQAARFFTRSGESFGGVRDVETKGASVIPVLCITKAWFMGGMHGVTCELRK